MGDTPVRGHIRTNSATGQQVRVAPHRRSTKSASTPSVSDQALAAAAGDPYAQDEIAEWESAAAAIDDEIVAAGGYINVGGRSWLHPQVGDELAGRRNLHWREGVRRGWVEPQDYHEVEVLASGVEVVDGNGEPLTVNVGDDEIEIVDADGSRHCVGAPALHSNDGTLSYYYRGALHREDGPAVISPDGSTAWYLFGAQVEAHS